MGGYWKGIDARAYFFQIPSSRYYIILITREIFKELDSAVDKALNTALNFEQLEEYLKLNNLYLGFVKRKQ